MIVLEAVGLIEGQMAVLAVPAVVVSAVGGDIAVGSDKGFASIAFEGGIVLAVGADKAGSYVALFFPAWSPVWWTSAAS